MKKRLIILCMVLLIISPFLTLNVCAQSNIIRFDYLENTNPILRSDILQWVYKSFNGKMYKRLWNGTKAKWITEWIPA